MKNREETDFRVYMELYHPEVKGVFTVIAVAFFLGGCFFAYRGYPGMSIPVGLIVLFLECLTYGFYTMANAFYYLGYKSR